MASLPLALRSAPLLLLALLAGCRPPDVVVDVVPPASAPTVSTIAFGSCARQDLSQPVWERVLERAPDLFVLLGDNIYAEATERAALDAEYALLGVQPAFARLRATVPLLAVWDDHDYGENDGGADNPLRPLYEDAFLDFFDAAADDPRRRRRGIYDAAVFGPPGRRVQVILLDLRSFRDPLIRNPAGESVEWGRYVARYDRDATLLGAAQWAWLEAQLRRPAELRILVSSIQAVADDHWWEKWGNLPYERRRLFRLIRDVEAEGVVIISGDRHLAELSLLPAEHPDGVGYPLYDFTSSGLTHGTGLENELNRFRVEAAGGRYTDPNFGLIEIDWDADPPMVRLEAVAVEDGAAVIAWDLPLASLRR